MRDLNLPTSNTDKTQSILMLSSLTNFFKKMESYQKIILVQGLVLFILRFGFPSYFVLLTAVPFSTYMSFFILWVWGFIFYYVLQIYLINKWKYYEDDTTAFSLEENKKMPALPWYIPGFIKRDFKVANNWFIRSPISYHTHNLFLLISMLLLMLVLILIRCFIP